MPGGHQQQAYFADLAERLNSAPHGRKSELIAEAVSTLGVSRNWVYERLREAGYRPGRRRRRDCGKSKLAEEQAQVVASLIVESTRANGKILLSTEAALEIAHANGLITENVSASTVNRVMKRAGFHPRQLAQPEPHMPLRSVHPNHLWQLDVSVCVLFYLDRGGLAVMDEKRFYKNKPRNLQRVAKQRVLRYLVTDHYTGAFFLRYYVGSGETQELLFEFLVEAFRGREHPQDPFCGVPFNLLWDAGSANQSHLVKGFLDGLGVHHHAHTPGRPQAKGQVERTHDLVERDFEGRLYMLNVRDLEHLNERAGVWMRHRNGCRPHSRTGTTRYGLWQTIRPEQLRECPDREICEHLLRTRPEPRTVKPSLTIQYKAPSFESRLYSVEHVPGVRVGDTVSVAINPYRAPNVLVLEEDENGAPRSYECTPIERDAAGFRADAPVFGETYRAPRDTDTDRHRKEMRKAAHGADTQQEADKARAARKPAFGGAVDPFSYLEGETVAHYIQRPGRPIDVPPAAHVELKPMTHVEAMKRLRTELRRPIRRDENQAVRNRFPDGVPEDQIKEVAAWLAGHPSRMTEPTHQSGGTSL